MKNKLRLSIGISAYNEERNIRRALKSVLSQKQLSYKITEVLVYSDGSTDNTVARVKSLRSKKIKIFDDGNRMGKPSRLNMIFRKFSGDVLVLMDADMYLKSNMSIENILSVYKSDRKIHLVAGNTQPTYPKTFIESAVSNFKICRDELEEQFSFGSTAYGAHAYLAYSKKFAKSLYLPENILNDDAYSYFECIKRGYKFAFARKSETIYRPPQNLKDLVSQSLRHRAGGVQLYEYFGRETVLKAFHIPFRFSFLLMLKQLIKDPIAYVFLRACNIYFYIKSNYLNSKFDIKWDIIHSSKTLSGK